MPDSASIVVTDSERKKLRQMVEFRKNPAQGIKRMKRLRLASWIASVFVVSSVLLFDNSVPEMIKVVLLLFAGAVLGFNIFQGQTIDNVPLTFKFVEGWNLCV